MQRMVWGLAGGAVLSLAILVLLGFVHRYVFGPALEPFGHADFFASMSIWGFVALMLIRMAAAWAGSSLAVRVSDEPHAAWTGPFVVLVCALSTIMVMGMMQPIWSFLLSAVLVVAVGWVVGRLHVGLPIIPEELLRRDADG